MNAIQDCWLIERCGLYRQVWGPYTESRARREAGKRHAIALDSHGHLANAKILRAEDVRTMMRIGSLSMLTTDTADTM